jgi:hypothetical protein
MLEGGDIIGLGGGAPMLEGGGIIRLGGGTPWGIPGIMGNMPNWYGLGSLNWDQDRSRRVNEMIDRMRMKMARPTMLEKTEEVAATINRTAAARAR